VIEYSNEQIVGTGEVEIILNTVISDQIQGEEVIRMCTESFWLSIFS
jgi:hypothetical protein